MMQANQISQASNQLKAENNHINEVQNPEPQRIDENAIEDEEER